MNYEEQYRSRDKDFERQMMTSVDSFVKVCEEAQEQFHLYQCIAMEMKEIVKIQKNLEELMCAST
jgi:hypothetical protein